jgi:hypothetical protein
LADFEVDGFHANVEVEDLVEMLVGEMIVMGCLVGMDRLIRTDGEPAG